MTDAMREDTREKLKGVSTATLTTVLFKRGFRNTFVQGIHRINPGAPRMVGRRGPQPPAAQGGGGVPAGRRVRD